MYELYNMLHMLQMLHMKPVIEGCDMCLLTEIVFKDGNYQCKAIVINKTFEIGWHKITAMNNDHSA